MPGVSSSSSLCLLCRGAGDPELLLRWFCMMWPRYVGRLLGCGLVAGATERGWQRVEG